MIDWRKWLSWPARDEERRQEPDQSDKARMLEMDEPMAGAGGQLAGESKKSETEENLKRATGGSR